MNKDWMYKCECGNCDDEISGDEWRKLVKDRRWGGDIFVALKSHRLATDEILLETETLYLLKDHLE